LAIVASAVGQFVIFLAVVLVVVTAAHYYLWRRLVRDTTEPGRARRILTWVLVGLVVLVLSTFVGTRLLPHSLATALSWAGYLWLAVMFYLIVVLALLEIPALIARLVLRQREQSKELVAVPVGALVGAAESTGARADPAELDPPGPESSPGDGQSRRLFLARAVAITAGVAAVGIVGSGIGSALGMPQLKRIQIPLARLSRGANPVRIALVSDMHLGPLIRLDRTKRIVEMINALDADLVAMVGDLVDGSVAELGPSAAPLGSLQSHLGTYFVTGNHEYYSGYEEWIDEVARLGMRPLRNAFVELPGGLDLAGVNDPTGAGFGDGPDVARALAGRDPSRPVVLLAHQPVQAHDAAAHGVDLQLSGHTHGGQMVPFDLIVRAAQQPVVSGLGEVDGMPVYVTNGAGFWGPPVRVGAPPDITLVELHAP
jgi:uncharacterized protein